MPKLRLNRPYFGSKLVAPSLLDLSDLSDAKASGTWKTQRSHVPDIRSAVSDLRSGCPWVPFRVHIGRRRAKIDAKASQWRPRALPRKPLVQFSGRKMGVLGLHLGSFFVQKSIPNLSKNRFRNRPRKSVDNDANMTTKLTNIMKIYWFLLVSGARIK